MPLFRKKPVVIEAFQFLGSQESARDIQTWVRGLGGNISIDTNLTLAGTDIISLRVHTWEGVMHAEEGDWVIKGVKAEFYPCKPDVFVISYEQES